MDPMTLSICLSLAMSLFSWGFREMQKKKEDRKIPVAVPVLGMAASVGFFVWAIFLRSFSAMLAVASWEYLLLGGLSILIALALFFRPPKNFASRGRAILYLAFGLLMVAMGLGLLAFGAGAVAAQLLN